MEEKNYIEEGRAALGIELGSTRIKAVMIDGRGRVLASGVYDWENTLENHVWTYSFEEIEGGLQESYAALKRAVREKYGAKIGGFRAIGISAMMHGYIALDEENRALTPFQTWRNTNTREAADRLTELFHFNIPQRWSIAHSYQRILDGEPYCGRAAYISTLSSYIHRKLTGRHVIGVGDASGMFPIDSASGDYDEAMVRSFDRILKERGYGRSLRELFPAVLSAGEEAGRLTEAGALFLDPSGELPPGIPLCPPEGDAGTGMAATDSVAPGSGNVSAGTSVFAMIVLEKQLTGVYREIDMVTTPEGRPVAMSHANNGSSDLNAWVRLFGEFAELCGRRMSEEELFEALYRLSLEGDADAGGLLSYGYYSGENIIMLDAGRPLFLRTPDSRFNLKNFMRAHLYSSLGAVQMGLDLLRDREGVKIERITGHGGFFKTPGVGQRYLSAAVRAPVTVMKTAGEGGAWGAALLAGYLVREKREQSLERYLREEIFSGLKGEELEATEEEQDGFQRFMGRYRAGLEVERSAVRCMNW